MTKKAKPKGEPFLVKIHNEDGSMSEAFQAWATQALSEPPPEPKKRKTTGARDA